MDATFQWMHDPLEGVSERGTIVTGIGRDKVPPLFERVLEAAVAAVESADVSLYVYGSVATGMARIGVSDVDLLTIGLAANEAASIAQDLSERFAGLCRGVEVAAANASDFEGDRDEVYGGRVFLRHYCVHLSGSDLRSSLPEFSADTRAARCFNGDIAQHVETWRGQLGEGRDPGDLGRRVARKSLLAVAGLVSVHDGTWTTDRRFAAARWSEINPALAADLETFTAWSSGDRTANEQAVSAALGGAVAEIASAFERTIGLWN